MLLSAVGDKHQPGYRGESATQISSFKMGLDYRQSRNQCAPSGFSVQISEQLWV